MPVTLDPELERFWRVASDADVLRAAFPPGTGFENTALACVYHEFVRRELAPPPTLKYVSPENRTTVRESIKAYVGAIIVYVVIKILISVLFSLMPAGFWATLSQWDRYFVTIFFAGAVPLFVALWVFHRRILTWGNRDRLTRCGVCGYILKGLTEPRCPECGERF